MAKRIRFLVFITLLVTLVGTLVELGLLEHYLQPAQRIPIFILDIAILVTIWFRIQLSGAWSGRIFFVCMSAMLLIGAVGVVLHYNSNMLFALEYQPSLSGMELFSESMTGATPTLAPLMMTFVGSLGIIYFLLVKHLKV